MYVHVCNHWFMWKGFGTQFCQWLERKSLQSIRPSAVLHYLHTHTQGISFNFQPISTSCLVALSYTAPWSENMHDVWSPYHVWTTLVSTVWFFSPVCLHSAAVWMLGMGTANFLRPVKHGNYSITPSCLHTLCVHVCVLCLYPQLVYTLECERAYLCICMWNLAW